MKINISIKSVFSRLIHRTNRPVVINVRLRRYRLYNSRLELYYQSPFRISKQIVADTVRTPRFNLTANSADSYLFNNREDAQVLCEYLIFYSHKGFVVQEACDQMRKLQIGYKKQRQQYHITVE